MNIRASGANSEMKQYCGALSIAIKSSMRALYAVTLIDREPRLGEGVASGAVIGEYAARISFAAFRANS